MFERFTQEARQAVVQAQEEARALHQDWVGTEHLLLALLSETRTSTAAILARYGLDHDEMAAAISGYGGTDRLDAEALTALGIDLDAVRDRIEASFGPGALDREAPGSPQEKPSGHIPFTKPAKKALELSLREAIALKSKGISDGHLVLGVLRTREGMGVKVLTDRDVDVSGLQREVRAALEP
jgi:ATP-dependent Clp protease ATP-binding subunit ClpA